MMHWLKKLLKDEDGPTAVEYAVMLAMILMVVIGTIQIFGEDQATGWGNIQGEIEAEFEARGVN